MAKKEKVSYVRLQFSDILGNIKAVEISVSQLPDALDNKIIFDGSSIEGFVRIKEADMFLHPDFSTWMILSFEDNTHGTVARLICDVYTSYGKPFQGDTRYILKKQIKALNDAGIASFDCGFEPEFFLFKLDSEGNPTVNPVDNGSYFDLSPIDGAEYVRRDIALELENNTGSGFFGKDNLIPHGSHFYLIGKLDPNAKTAPTLPEHHALPPYRDGLTTNTVHRVFIQDHKTTVNFKIGEFSLQYAYLNIPDLRSSSVTLGLSVDLSWSTGINFGEVVIGGNSQTPIPGQ
jgi:hypothetical protein